MQPTSKFRDWASMTRLPNIPTVWSNVFTAWILGSGSLKAWGDGHFLSAFAGATLLYAGGTILNDVFDVDFDRLHRPERPIPSGRVSLNLAKRAAVLLLGFGTALLFLDGSALALVMPVCIVLYTFLHKKDRTVGVILMAACRVMLALTVAICARMHVWQNYWANSIPPPSPVGFWITALFAYICTISWLAKNETRPQRRLLVGLMLAALPLLDAVALMIAGKPHQTAIPLACFISVLILRRYASAT